ncbi:MAG: DUF2334 domain-containing protein [Candidatus Moranbacteria bacterium]|nr:DUF2334 domain-containing protein [Candidatus Moranbacteria bacterium]
METPQGRKSYLVSSIIVLIVLLFSGGSVVYFLNSAYHDDTSVIDIARDAVCIQQADRPSALVGRKLVVLRLDDVQSYAWRDVSMSLMRGAFKYGVPIVAGVIPKDIEKDTSMMHFLKRNRCNMEIAMHGWDHSGGEYDPSNHVYLTEFGQIGYDDAIRRIDLGKKALSLISNKPLTTFIPPFNLISDEGKRAVRDEGFSVNSSEGKNLFDYVTSPYDFATQQMIPIKGVVDTCEKIFAVGRPCVIMLHPQEYADENGNLDMQKYTENYEVLLKTLVDNDVTFTTFEDIIQPKSTLSIR